ncbi:MAG: hypothetical protein mread185_000106 [Mycoplasmataceae bacterium]|nr:MAG: hypothetical protein mread185_000106 [Mycoplasmataceae bacterium]
MVKSKRKWENFSLLLFFKVKIIYNITLWIELVELVISIFTTFANSPINSLERDNNKVV